MMEIGKQPLGRPPGDALADAMARRGQPRGRPQGREVHDTVEISGGGKQVNLARGLDLAREVRAEKDPDKVREMVRAGSDDIARIGRLFREVFKEIFAMFRARR